MNILISACLLGVNCRYNGIKLDTSIWVKDLSKKHHFIPVCPEVFGGMQTPRPPSEIQGGKVLSHTGKDVTEYYKRGAQEVLELAQFYDCHYAILKERSPSCGYGKIYDGSFSGHVIDGNGVAADLLAKNGITIIGESQIEMLL